MEFTVSSSVLFNHLQSIGKIINPKNTLQILDCFLFQLGDNSISITASDSETTLITEVETIESKGSGLFAISAKTILDPLKDFPEQPIRFVINENTMEIVIYSSNGKYNFLGQDGNEYPKPNELKENKASITIGSQELLNAINRTLFATADDEFRPIMNGIYFDLGTDKSTFVASDGHKLVRFTQHKIKASDNASFILPKRPATILKNILPKEDGEISLDFDEKNAIFVLKDYKVICRLIEGRYPNYNTVIPQNNPNKVIVDRISFMTALKRVSAFSNQASNLIKLQFGEGSLMISAQDLDFSTSAEENIICQYTGNPLNIGFKATFLIEILNNLTTNDIQIELADQSRAGILLPSENEENENILMLLMPMMLND